MTLAPEDSTPETEELNYDDYTHDFMGKVGNVADFSRDFLVGLARVFEDVLNFMPYAHVKTYSEKVGIDAAMDVTAKVSRAVTPIRSTKSRFFMSKRVVNVGSRYSSLVARA